MQSFTQSSCLIQNLHTVICLVMELREEFRHRASDLFCWSKQINHCASSRVCPAKHTDSCLEVYTLFSRVEDEDVWYRSDHKRASDYVYNCWFMDYLIKIGFFQRICPIRTRAAWLFTRIQIWQRSFDSSILMSRHICTEARICLTHCRITASLSISITIIDININHVSFLSLCQNTRKSLTYIWHGSLNLW